MRRNQHVVPHDNGWAVKGERTTKPTVVTKTQAEAETIAREIARNNKSEIFIHGKNGRIRERDSYGNDPCPPVDNE